MSTKSYIIPAPHYRLGVLYEAGAIVTIPAKEKPGRGWELVEEGASRPAKAAVAPKPPATDASPI